MAEDGEIGRKNDDCTRNDKDSEIRRGALPLLQLQEILQNKWDYLPLLLLGDEQESQIASYLERGRLFVWQPAAEPRGVAVVTQEGDGVYELKNLAVAPAWQRQGYGSAMVRWLFQYYQALGCRVFWVGTGEAPGTLAFYRSLGFVEDHRVPDFFLQYYDHPIWEDGVLLRDMIYLKKAWPADERKDERNTIHKKEVVE